MLVNDKVVFTGYIPSTCESLKSLFQWRPSDLLGDFLFIKPCMLWKRSGKRSDWKGSKRPVKIKITVEISNPLDIVIPEEILEHITNK